MVPIYINNILYYTEENSTVLQACLNNNVKLPSFCFHEKLNIAGNCRMCLIEVEKSPKPVASCALPVMKNMKIYTNSPLVKKAREAVLEFLLLNHPLDCPICDQGGECDLQDQTLIYGSDRSRFYFYKRVVTDKNCGPFIKTIMTRCIHCTRCVRFCTEIAGLPYFGTLGRGVSTEIGTYIEKLFSSEISGNVIDLCPVGALTSKPYAFRARPWENKSFFFIDFFDSLNSNVLIESKSNKILRILPSINNDLNEEWISDKIRFCQDSLLNNRIISPFRRKLYSHNLINRTLFFDRISWNRVLLNYFLNLKQLSFFNLIKSKKNYSYISLKKPRITKFKTVKFWLFIGNFLDFFSLTFIKILVNKLSLSTNLFSIKNKGQEDFRYYFLFNKFFKNLKKMQVCLLLNIDLKVYFPVINAKFIQLEKKNYIKIYVVGNNFKPNFYNLHLSLHKTFLLNLLKSNTEINLLTFFRNNKEFNLFSSIQNFTRIDTFDYNLILKNFSIFLVKKFNTCKVNLLSFFSENSNQVSKSELGNLHNSSFKIYTFFEQYYKILNCNNLNYTKFFLFNYEDFLFTKYRDPKKYILHLTSHEIFNSNGFLNSSLILPTKTCFEKNNLFINFEGRVQQTTEILKSLPHIREEFQIINNLLKDFDLKILNENLKFFVYKTITNNNNFLKSKVKFSTFSKYNSLAELKKIPFYSKYDDFLQTDIFSRSSIVLSSAYKKRVNKTNFL